MQDYTITRRLISIGRSYTVENRNGERRFSIAGKVRFARTFSVKDKDSTVLYSVREKLLALHPTFVITRDGVETAVVTRTADEDSGEKFRIDLPSGEAFEAAGKLWYDEGVRIFRGSGAIGSIRRRQNEIVHERFLVEAAESADQGLMLAIAMSIAETAWHRGQI